MPFPDGNGRVGRLIALKECLRFGLIPFIIEDAKKMYYYRGLSEWEWEESPALKQKKRNRHTPIPLKNPYITRFSS